MKHYTTARIIIWSIVAVICFGVLFAGLSVHGKSFPWLNFGVGMGYAYSGSEKYAVGGGSVIANDTQSIEINWISGNVDVVPYDGDTIQFDEKSYGSVDEAHAMRYLAENGKFIIQFCSPRVRWRSLRNYRKDLTVKLPYELALRNFTLNAVSVDIHLEGIRAGDLDINSVTGSMTVKDTSGETITLKNVSGNIAAEDILAATLRANTVSGHINIAAKVERAKLNSVSGLVKLYTDENVRDIDIVTVSGGISLELPENDGFNVRYSSVSGGFNCEFPVEISGKHGIYKNGIRDISFKTVSGGMSIVRRQGNADL